MKKSSILGFAAITAFLTLNATGCPAGGGSASTSSGTGNSGGNSSGSGGTFAAADIMKGTSWTTNCLTGSEPFTGADHYIAQIYFGSGYFNYNEQWFTGSCTGPNNLVNFSVSSGSWSLGGVINSSSNLQTLTLTASTSHGCSQIATSSSATRTAINNSCGGTSPYTGGNANSSAWFNSDTFNCMVSTRFPQISGTQHVMTNVVGWDGTNLTLANAGVGRPGFFSDETVPTTATVSFH